MAEVLDSGVGVKLANALKAGLPDHIHSMGVFEAEVTKVTEEVAGAGTPFKGRSMTLYDLKVVKMVRANPSSEGHGESFVTSVKSYDCGPRGPVEGVVAGSRVILGVYKYKSGISDNAFGMVKLPDGNGVNETSAAGSSDHGPMPGSAGNLLPGQDKPFPSRWGEPPRFQTKDLREWPEGYGKGSGTIARWIEDNMHEDTSPPGSAGNLIPGQRLPFPGHWGEPPMRQTKDLREWPQGYGQGSGTIATWIQDHLDHDGALAGSAGNLLTGQTKPFPSHWGDPPRIQTKDLQDWPEGYGRGSGTLKAWIDKMLQKDGAQRGSAGHLIPGQTTPFPSHWGEPPRMMTRDMRIWRGGYGQGSGTIATWIQEHLTKDASASEVKRRKM